MGGHKPGDEVNGYRLDASGTVWEPVALGSKHGRKPMAPGQGHGRRRVTGRRVALAGGAGVVGLVLLGAVVTAVDGDYDLTCGQLAAEARSATPERLDQIEQVADSKDCPLPLAANDETAAAMAQKQADEQAAAEAAKAEADRVAAEAAAQASTQAAADEAAAAQAAIDAATSTGVVTKVIDGDTVDVGGVGRIRVIGIDTPERGDCNYALAAQALEAAVLGKTVSLVPGARDDVDKYGRLLRYVDVGGVDAGLGQITAGYAIARYDSRDGYGAHTREAQYIAADAASAPRGCPAQAPAPAPAPAAPAPPAPGGCDPNYGGGCVPLVSYDLDCGDIGFKVQVLGDDPHGFDREGDGWGCESYG